MLAEFELIGRVARITDLSTRRDSNTSHLVTVATTRSWQDERTQEWQEKTFFHTLTVYSGLTKVVRGLEVGDLVRFSGDIESWQTRGEGAENYRQGVTLILRNRRILARKRQSGGEETGSEGSQNNGSTPDTAAPRGEARNGNHSRAYAR